MRRLTILTFLLSLLIFLPAKAIGGQPAIREGEVNFFICNDMGRNGYYDQKPIAERMGRMAEELDISCVVAAGDIHHFEGVASVNDPLWMTNYELIYAHPELMLPWYPILGNHEYRGSTRAVLDYAGVSRRWEMADRYYTKVLEGNGTTVRLILLDTTPLIDKYRKDTAQYPDVEEQNLTVQLDWLERTLKDSQEDWIVVVGHHPIFAETGKSDKERIDMQQRVNPILSRHRVDFYVCGHIHNFQHIRQANNPIDYIVNSAASLSRPVKAVEGTQFCSPEPGFSVVTATKTTLNLHMVDKDGHVLYTIERKK